eukprot:UN09968
MVSRSHFVVLLIAALLDTVSAALLIYLVCRVIKNVLKQSSNEDNSMSTVIKSKSTNSYKVMLQRTENKNKIDIEAADHNDNNVQIIGLGIVDAWTRYTLLVVIGIISSYIANLFNLYVIKLPAGEAAAFRGEYEIAYVIDTTINALALYFLFSFNDRQYYKICGFCHRLCEQCCIDCAFRCTDKDKLSQKTKQQC